MKRAGECWSLSLSAHHLFINRVKSEASAHADEAVPLAQNWVGLDGNASDASS
jgi:hypothetical protein